MVQLKFLNKNLAEIIKPGEQARFENASMGFKIVKPNLEEVLAWREGKFLFEGAAITSIMRQISRWYDVDVVYSGKIPTARFGGYLLKEEHPAILLDALTRTEQVYFIIDGKRITVIEGRKPLNNLIYVKKKLGLCPIKKSRLLSRASG